MQPWVVVGASFLCIPIVLSFSADFGVVERTAISPKRTACQKSNKGNAPLVWLRRLFPAGGQLLRAATQSTF